MGYAYSRRQRAIQSARQMLNGPSGRWPDAEPTPDLVPAPAAPQAPRRPVCDRSGDAGSTHYWYVGSTKGDKCLCGKWGWWMPHPCPAGASYAVER